MPFANRALLDAILEQSAHGILICDARGKMVHQNPAALRIWAGSAPTESVADWGQYKGFHPEDGRPFTPEDWGMARCLATREVIPHHEIVIERFDGTRGVLLASASPLVGADGTLEGAMSIFADVTASKRIELERLFMLEAGDVLAASLDFEVSLTQLARLAVPRIADWCGIDMLDESGALHRVALGYPPESKPLAQSMREDTEARRRETLGVWQVLKSRETLFMPSIDQQAMRANITDEQRREQLGRLHPRSLIIVPLIAHGRALGAITLLHAESNRRFDAADVRFAEDLARRVALQLDNARLFQEARHQQEALTTLAQLGEAIAAEINLEALVQLVTDAGVQLCGAQFGAFFYNVTQGTETMMLWSVSGASRESFAKFPMPRTTAMFAPTFKGDGVVRVDDVTCDPRYGKNPPHHGMPEGHLPVKSYLAVPVTSRSGEVIGGLLFGHPQAARFTIRHEQMLTGLAAQAATAMDNARLFGRANGLIKDLERTNRELDQFAYVASHDLKAPLRGIANLAQWIEEDAGDALAATAKDQLHLLRGRVVRLEGLIQGILDYSRAGRAGERVETFELGRLLNEVVEILGTASVRWADPLPTFTTQKTPLLQVFLNLVGNAIKHARRDDPVIDVTCVARESEFEIAVSDNGPGIEPRFHERIFEIFQTLKSREDAESTGIGLAIVRKIVDARGGRVWVDSELGRGATFRFTWPRTA